MSALRVLALSDDPDSASARVRLSHLRAPLRDHGITLEVRRLPHRVWPRLRSLARIPAHDALVLSRKTLDPLSLRVLRRATPCWLFDVDDAVFARPFGRRVPRRLPRRWHATCLAADRVLTGSSWLAQAAPAPAQLLLPSCPDWPRPAPRSTSGPLRCVWTGSHATLPYLEALLPHWPHPECHLTVICDRPPTSPTPFDFVPWSEASEARALDEAEVGLYPLHDDPWSRGKCAYKVWLYQRHGLACLVVPQGGGAEALGPAPGDQVVQELARWPKRLRRWAGERREVRDLGARNRSRWEAAGRSEDRAAELARILREVTST